MTSPIVDWAALTPVLIILGSAVLGVIFEAFVPRKGRRAVQVTLTMLAIAASLVAVVWRATVVFAEGPSSIAQSPDSNPAGIGTLVEDGVALAFQLIILVCAFFAVLVIADRTQTGEGAFAASAATQPGSRDERDATAAGLQQTEVYPLVLFSLGGMMTFTSAGDLLTLFVALEVLSLPLYVLAATARRRRALSQEAAMKYFLLGAFSSAFFLMGSALLYGYAGTLTFRGIAPQIGAATGMDMLLISGVVLILAGLLFKVGAVPFHSWTPDTYQGAPTPITGYMAAGTKIAAFAAMLRSLPHRLRHPVGAHAGTVDDYRSDDARRYGCWSSPDRHQALAGLLVYRSCRIHSHCSCLVLAARHLRDGDVFACLWRCYRGSFCRGDSGTRKG